MRRMQIRLNSQSWAAILDLLLIDELHMKSNVDELSNYRYTFDSYWAVILVPVRKLGDFNAELGDLTHLNSMHIWHMT